MTPGHLFSFVLADPAGERHETRPGYGHDLGEQLRHALDAVTADAAGARVVEWRPVRPVGPRAPELEAPAA